MTSIVSSVGFTMLLRDAIMIPGCWRWVVAQLLLACAMVATALTGIHSPPQLVFWFANAIVLVSFVFQLEAIFIFSELAYPRRFLYVYEAVGVAAIAIAFAFGHSLAVLEGTLAAFCAPLAAYVVYGMFANRGRPLRFSDFFVALGYALMFVGFVICAVTVPPAVSPAGTVANGPVQSFFYGLLFVAVVCGQASYVVMTKEESDFRLMLLATLDPLTAIWNRRTFIEAAEAEQRRCLRKALPVALVLFDLDHFKRINDTFGHAEGDRVLKAFASTVRSMVREYDLVGRYGGEEFIVLFPDTAAEAAVATADRIREACAASSLASGTREIRYTTSAGVAVTDASTTTFEGLLLRADTALYAAKAAGRNRVVLAD